MVLSAYCCYPWWSLFFTTSARWFHSYIQAVEYAEDLIYAPTLWTFEHLILWPPDGPFLNAALFGLAILSCLATFVWCLFAVCLEHLSVLRLGRLLDYFEHCSKRLASNLSLNARQVSLCSSSLQVNLRAAFTAVAVLTSQHHEVTQSNVVSFDSDSIPVVIDNSANAHIWNRLDDFIEGSVHYFDDSDDVGVLTIGKDQSRPLGQGLVPISIVDDNGTSHDITLHNALYFPDSPVNIISVTALAAHYDDSDGTFIKTMWKSSVFTWNHGKFSKTFSHPASRLPVLHVNTGFGEYNSYYSMLDNAGLAVTPTALTTCRSCLPHDMSTNICFVTAAPQSQPPRPLSLDEVDHILQSTFKPGQRLQLKHNGIYQHVDLISVRVDDETAVPYFTVVLTNGNTLEVTKEHLSALSEEDLADIPITPAQIRTHANHLDEETLAALLDPPPQSKLVKEFYAWHFRTGHLSFDDMFRLCENGHLPRKFLTLKDQKLICPSCIFGKCKRKAWRSKSAPGQIRKDEEVSPGDATSIDHVISKQPGLVPRMDGKHSRQRINSVCVFIDHVSNHSYSHLQTSVDVEQTVLAKNGYEQYADSHGVSVKSYRADNGIFAQHGFREQVKQSNQSISFCAVGAHHQNGIAENRIGVLTRGARTNLLHAQRRWPAAIGTILWPFAWKDFERKYNHFHLDKDGLSPMNKFNGVHVQADLREFHPFGCPVFVLDHRLQSGPGAAPKWEPRSRVGVYLGHSPCHAGSVALVLNPKTLRVSPQYHVVFDDEFCTVPHMEQGTVPPQWTDLCVKSAELATDEDFDLATTWANEYISGRATAVDEEDGSGNPILLNQNAIPLNQSTNSEEVEDFSVSEEEEDVPVPEAPLSPSREDEEDTGVTDPLLFPTMPDLNELTCRRSRRQRKATSRASGSTDRTVRRIFGLYVACTCMASGLIEGLSSVATSPLSTTLDRVVLHAERINTHFDGTINSIHHAALAASVGDNDTYTLKDMLKQDDKIDFIKAMEQEVKDHEQRDHWTLYPRSAMPQGTKTIMSVWSFKRKRFPDGRVKKHKARLCAHGGMQTWGVNYWETYAPVVNWLSVRALMVISILHDLETRSIDFVLAFPQAEVKADIWMELPYGFDVDGNRRYILKLNKNLYGLCDASRTFWEMLKEGLEARGYTKQSMSDHCVFYGKDSIVLVYVDDCIVLSKKGSKAADRLIEALNEGHENFDFTDDGDLTTYLGVDVKRHKDGSVELTQPHLIKRFLEVLGYDSSVNPRPTPAVKPLLNKDADGLPRKYEWNYRQAIGMLNYMVGITRPEMAMAVHQAARFTINPMLSHERAVQRIAKYLLGTLDKGIIFKPNKKGLECFVDADFAGGWSKTDAMDSSTVLSRTGYVIMFSGCPLVWCSKLQTEIALSTTEAEYIALSQAMREVIPLMQLLREINEVFPIDLPTPDIRCQVWEDNNGCISVAKNEKFSPRTKHIAIKYHHFRQHVKDGIINILPIDTKEQTADIFTKPLDESLFVHLRKKLNGW